MSITKEAAADALRIAHEASERSAMLRGYQSAAPHLILWGCAYAAAYSYGYFAPENAGLAWLVAVPVTSIGDIIVAWRDKGEQTDSGNWTALAGLFATFLAFITAAGAIFQPQDPKQMAAFVPLVVAACYTVLGIWLGRRMVLAGIALGALTMFGFFALPTYFMLWMAAVGGGTLILTGLWLRQA